MEIDEHLLEIPDIRLDKTPRPQQKEMLDFTINSIKSNNKYIMLNCPTGIGKSFFAVMFMDWFKREFDRTATFDVLTNSKILQEQYTKDFDFMNSLWGKASYDCEHYQTNCETGLKMAKLNNHVCHNCPYKIAKHKFDNGIISLSNFHLFLTYHIFVPVAWKRTSRVLIIDEGDTFEDVYCDFISTDVNKFVLKSNGFDDHEIVESMQLFSEFMTIEEFIDAVEVLSEIGYRVINRLAMEFQETNNIKTMETGQTLKRTIQKWELLRKQYENKPDNWILESEMKKIYTKNGGVREEYLELSMKPIWAYPYLPELWDKYDYVIFMSGTILDKQIFSDMNGLDPNRSTYLELESPFPLENRPIFYFKNAGQQTYNSKQITWQNQKKILSKIFKKHKKDKGIIHTANYELQRWVGEAFDSTEKLLSHTSNDRNEILNAHYNSNEPTILVSPSMHVGVDLPGNFSRFQVMLKMPYPNLGSEKIKKRMQTMKEYYGITTVRNLIQSYGRSIRSKEDYADTYIIDSSFDNVLKWNGKYFPKWFTDAIQFVE